MVDSLVIFSKHWQEQFYQVYWEEVYNIEVKAYELHVAKEHWIKNEKTGE